MPYVRDLVTLTFQVYSQAPWVNHWKWEVLKRCNTLGEGLEGIEDLRVDNIGTWIEESGVVRSPKWQNSSQW